MKSKVEYQVLSPNSVAWFIQAALVADRSGNEHTRDLALSEAQRIAAERRLVETVPTVKRHDGRTTEQRLADLETRVKGLTTALGACALSATVHGHAERLEALERNQRVEHRTMHETFNQQQARLEGLENMITSLHEHQVLDARRVDALEQQQREQSLVLVSHEQRLDCVDEELGDQTQRLAALETVIANLGIETRLESQVAGQRDGELVLLENGEIVMRRDCGFWVPCPFCKDDEKGFMCCACNGTRRIWEMPAEDGG